MKYQYFLIQLLWEGDALFILWMHFLAHRPIILGSNVSK